MGGRTTSLSETVSLSHSSKSSKQTLSLSPKSNINLPCQPCSHQCVCSSPRYVQDHAATLGAAAIAATCLMVTIQLQERRIKNIFDINMIITTNPTAEKLKQHLYWSQALIFHFQTLGMASSIALFKTIV